jgi:hypothetical protein
MVLYENIGGIFFKDVWKARNDYINIILDNSYSAKIKFFEDNALRTLTENEMDTCIRILEMQKYAMFIYTSCGWFFSEISGLETVKILEYASRAMEISKELTGVDIEPEFIKKLAKAKSNIPKYKNGKGVYEKLVRPAHFIGKESAE